MQRKELAQLLQDLLDGGASIGQTMERIGLEPYLETGQGLNLDMRRGIRTGIPEVVFGAGKSKEQLITAVKHLARAQNKVLVTRLEADAGNALTEMFPGGEYHELPCLFVLEQDMDLDHPWNGEAEAMIISAGGADLPVALEAYACLKFFGHTPGLVSDVGVAGLHRLFPHLPKISKARILIVIAGMEGALPSVLAGLSPVPIVAVPTSVGYGTSLGGITPMLAMLTSCAPGISVVNIDNGFGAACFAFKVLENRKSEVRSQRSEN